MATGVGDWARGPAIGRGSSATVSLAVDRRTGAVFAVKSVEAARAGELLREQNILRGLSSPHVVRCLGYSGVSAAAGSCDLFLEYAPGGSLADEIKLCGGRCEELLIRARARDVLRGLAHIHAAGVAHCDVKGRNVLIGADGRAMIADFGCARRVAADGGGGGIGGEKLRGGTPMFMAPEAARGEEQGTAADIWALGCTVIEMATGGAPWPTFADPIAALRHVALSCEVPECPQWLSEDGKDFLARCLRRDPRERWTAERLLQHQFVAATATATSSSSNSIPSAAEKELFASPKSVLDQALWDDSTAGTTAAPTTAPTDRVRALAAGAPVVPDWTWDANWITVHRGDGGSDDELSMMPPELEAEAVSDRLFRSSAAGSVSGFPPVAEEAVNLNANASHGHGNFYGDAISSCSGESGDSFCGGNHVVSDCNLAFTGNGFFQRCSVTLVLSCPSWLLTFRMFLSFFPLPITTNCKLAAYCSADWNGIAERHIRQAPRDLFFKKKMRVWSCETRDWQLGGGRYNLRGVRTEAAKIGEVMGRAGDVLRVCVRGVGPSGARDETCLLLARFAPPAGEAPSVTPTPVALASWRTFGTRAPTNWSQRAASRF